MTKNASTITHLPVLLHPNVDLRITVSLDATDAGYVQAETIESLPVATLVSEATYPNVPIQSSAPLENSEGQNTGGGSGGGCCVAGTGTNTQSTPWVSNQNHDFTVSRSPMMVHCKYCNQESRTRVTTAPNWKTWTASGCMFFVFWPLCWLPLVAESCKTTEHFCVTCGAKVARVDAFEDCCVEHRG